MNKFVIVSCLASLSLGAPSPQQVVGFGDATAQEIAEIRAGTYGEMFDDNPQYNFNYKVADNDEQTYMSQEENRDGDVVTGSYSYVDPYGSLITVTYQAGPMGYTETRDVQEGFVQIREKQQSSSSGFSSSSGSGSSFSSSGSGFSSGSSSSNFGSSSSGFGSSSSSGFGSSSGSSNFGSSSFSSDSSSSSGLSSSLSTSDIVSSVVNQISPLVSQTVSSAVSGASRRPSSSSSSSSLSNTQSTSSSSSSSNDVVNQVVSQIAPLVSQTVSSVVAGSGNSRQTSSTGRQIGRVRVPAVPRVVVPAPSPVIVAPAPRPIPAVVAPAPRVVPAPRPAPASSSLGDLFGGGNIVRINTPDFNIEY